MVKQTSIVEEVEVPDEWEIEQGFIDDQRELEEEEKPKLNDPTRYFKCYRCHRKVDRTKEFMMQFSGGNQTLGLANILRDYCWTCYWIVKREVEGRLSGLTGREFAFCGTEILNDRRNANRGFSVEMDNETSLSADEMPLLTHMNMSRDGLTKRTNELYGRIKEKRRGQ